MRIVFSKKLYLIHHWYREIDKYNGAKSDLFTSKFNIYYRNTHNLFSARPISNEINKYEFSFSFTASNKVLFVIPQYAHMLQQLTVDRCDYKKEKFNYHLRIPKLITEDFSELESLISKINNILAQEQYENEKELRRIKKYILSYHFMRFLEQYKPIDKGSIIYYKYFYYIEKHKYLGKVLVSDYLCRFFITAAIRADDKETIDYICSKGYKENIIGFYGKYLAVRFHFGYYSEDIFNIFSTCYNKFVSHKSVVKKIIKLYVS